MCYHRLAEVPMAQFFEDSGEGPGIGEHEKGEET